MIDTDSDMCLMRADCYVKPNAPLLRKNKIHFRGIGSDNKETLGEIDADIFIDNNIYPVKIRVVSNALMCHDLIIGADFLKTVEVTIKGDKISISKPKEDSDLLEIFQIDYAYEADKLDTAYLDSDCMDVLEDIIKNYKPDNT